MPPYVIAVHSLPPLRIYMTVMVLYVRDILSVFTLIFVMEMIRRDIIP